MSSSLKSFWGHVACGLRDCAISIHFCRAELHFWTYVCWINTTHNQIVPAMSSWVCPSRLTQLRAKFWWSFFVYEKLGVLALIKQWLKGQTCLSTVWQSLDNQVITIYFNRTKFLCVWIRVLRKTIWDHSRSQRLLHNLALCTQWPFSPTRCCICHVCFIRGSHHWMRFQGSAVMWFVCKIRCATVT